MVQLLTHIVPCAAVSCTHWGLWSNSKIDKGVFYHRPEACSIQIQELDIPVTVVPRLTITSLYDESAVQLVFCNRYCNRKTMFQWGFFRLTTIGSLLWEPIFRFTMIKNSWSLGFQNGSPLCSGRIACITGTGKRPPYGGSSLNGEVFCPLECISMGFLLSLDDISFYSDFAGTDYRHQAGHHCTSWQNGSIASILIAAEWRCHCCLGEFYANNSALLTEVLVGTIP